MGLPVDLRRKLIRIDGAAGRTVGTLVLVAVSLLEELYRLPAGLLYFTGYQQL